MSKPLRILILEDQPADAELITRELRKAGFEFVAKNVTSEKQFLAELRDQEPQVILADYSLPGYDGSSALAAAQKRCPEVPFIFVSGSLGEEQAIETLRSGTTDYVLKQRLARLGPAVRRALREREERRRGQQAEQRIRELNLVLRATGAINALMVRERDPERLLAEACKILVETRGFKLAWVGQVKPDSKRVVPAACAGKGADFLDAVIITWDETPTGRGPIGTAIRTGQPVVCQDTATDPRFAPWRDEAMARGFASMAAMPMTCGSRVLGAVAVYSERPGAFHKEELDLLQELAADLAFALQSIEHEQERKQLDEVLRESSQFNQQIVASAHEGVIVYGRDLKYQVWNPYMEQLTGMPAGEVLGKNPHELFPFLRESGVLASITKALAGEPTPSTNFHFGGLATGKSGWVSHTNGPLRNAAGETIGVIGIVHDISERRRHELRIAAFANLGQRLNAVKTAREAGEIIVAVADELLGWDACLFDLYSAAENRITHLLSMDLIDGRRTECKNPDPDSLPRQIPSRAVKQGGQLILRDHSEAMRPEGLLFGDMSRLSASLMFVPIRHGAEVLGILSIQSYTPKAYDASSLEALQALADYAGGALGRLRAQEALSESEATFRSVWENSIDGMRLTDKEGRIIAVNEAFSRLVKLPREKLEGQILSVAYNGHGPTEGLEVYQNRFASGDIVPHLATRAQLWNGEEADLDISSSFIGQGQRGKLLLSIFRDVSERRRAELRVEAFSNLGQRLSEARSPAEAARAIYASADLFWKWDSGALDLELAERGRIGTALAYDVVDGQRREVAPADPAGYGTPMIRRVMTQGAELILRNGQELEAADTIRFGDTSRPSTSIMCVPVRVESRTVGALSVQSYAPDAYTREDLQTLQALADHCGGALDRLRIEGALRASEVRYRRLFESAKDGILILDAETGMVVEVNPFLAQLLGFSREAVLGKQVWELGFFKDLVANQAHFEELQQKGYVRYEDLALETNGGQRIEVEFVSNVYLVNGKKVIQCNIRDISDRKRAEAALKRSHDQYRGAIAAANAIPYQKANNTGKYSFMGDAIKELTGYTPDELNSKVWGEMILDTVFLGEAAGLTIAEAARRSLAGEIKRWRADHHIRTKSGAIRWISDSSVQLFDADGKLSGSMGIIQDITDRKTLEEQLRQSQKMDAVGQLAGGVAHDFNNMLAVIRGNAELLLMDEGQHTAKTREGLKHVVEASERAANLTRQLLTFSRKQVMEPQPLLLNEVIANLTKMLNRVLRENIDLQCHYATMLPHVQADTGMMEQVILNLVINARDAMPGGGQLRLTTEQLRLDEANAQLNPEARAGEFVCLTVSDTGTGIPPEVLPHIFEPFFTTKGIGKGTGLGLANVYGIVQQHQGWIEVSSHIGEGSTFKVFLPSIPTPPQPAAAVEAGADVRGGNETILLVEDEHSVRLTTRRVLEGKGYTIREATNGREALELWNADAGGIALLLTDIMLPGEMTGRDLAERLWAQRPRLKVIFMSGYSAEVLGKGTDFIRRTKSHFLQKPCSLRAILETVRQCLDEKPLGATPGEAGREK